MLIVQPTLEMATWSNDRLAPMLRDTPAASGKVADARSRDKRKHIISKIISRWISGHRWCKQVLPVLHRARCVLFSLMRWIDIRQAPDRRRPDQFGHRPDKNIYAQPQNRDGFHANKQSRASRIETAFQPKRSCRYYHVPCPDCGHSQTLKWSNVHWTKDSPGDG